MHKIIIDIIDIDLPPTRDARIATVLNILIYILLYLIRWKTIVLRISSTCCWRRIQLLALIVTKDTQVRLSYYSCCSWVYSCSTCLHCLSFHSFSSYEWNDWLWLMKTLMMLIAGSLLHDDLYLTFMYTCTRLRLNSTRIWLWGFCVFLIYIEQIDNHL